jgi:BspA type Leucine rich repeat region (6 copies)
MKKTLLLFYCLNVILFTQAQVVKIVNIANAGTLYTLANAGSYLQVTDLTISGNIDARDFKTMRDNMPALKNINIGNVNIVSYTGTAGTGDAIATTYPANEIPQNSFSHSGLNAKTSLKSIILPNSTISIGSYAFAGCSGLTSIEIPNSVKTINDAAFYLCKGISNLVIPDGITMLFNNTFNGCSGLTTVIIGNGVNSIPDGTFAFCTNLSTLSIPNSVTTIGSAFWGASKLSIIRIGTGVTSIDNSAFDACTSLVNIEISPDNLNFSSIDGVLYNKSKTSIIRYPEGKQDAHFQILSGITSLGDKAFKHNIYLNDISIPDEIEKIGSYCFIDCTNLNTCTIGKSVTSIGDWGFSGCSSLKIIYSLNPSPAILGSNCFGKVLNVTDIFVQSDEAVASYIANDAWISYFSKDVIKKMIITNYNQMADSNVSIHTSNFNIVVVGVNENEIVTVYDQNGLMLQQIYCNSDRLTILMDRKGVYLVKVMKKTYKIVL